LIQTVHTGCSFPIPRRPIVGLRVISGCMARMYNYRDSL